MSDETSKQSGVETPRAIEAYVRDVLGLRSTESVKATVHDDGKVDVELSWPVDARHRTERTP